MSSNAQGAEASHTYPLQANALKKGGHVLLKGRPCKIVDMSSSKPGKHGHAKVKLTGLEIFSGIKIEDVFPASHTVEVPVVERKEYRLIYVDRSGFLELLDPITFDTRSDVNETQCVSGEVKERFQKLREEGKHLMAVLMSAVGREGIVEVKEIKEKKDE